MSDCSYSGLLNYLNLTASNKVLEIMRPVKNWSDSTVVKLDMVLLGILGVDEKLQTVSNQIWIQMYWTNEFLTWNSSEFCGIDTLTLPRSMVWIPDITIQEDVSDTASVQEDPLLSLDADGSLFAQVRQRLSYTCQLDLSMFPFDVQHCSITFSSMSSDGRMITLAAAYNDTILTSISVKYLKTQGEWKLTNLKVAIFNQSNENTFRSKLSYTVTLERKPFLYLINLIVPLCFLLFLDLTSFFIDEARGEKLGFKVTILLSISVLLLILQDMLPSTEENLPMIARYVVGVFTMMWMSILETMLVGFIIDLDACCGKQAPSSVEVEVDVQLEEPAGDEDKDQVKPEKDQPGERFLLKRILEKVKAVRKQAARQSEDKRKPGCYRRLAKIIDTLFFVLYFFAVAVFVLSIVTLWTKRQN
ncbi:5-hydroxytryptamine receptor 3A-like [Melanotaenia boesemani]|uniref:5-hydroxytryptamine receptor 3A-like n=1 Tax=Melanotaenia boesemani TaxID=1250792 RepID=UPI001C045784|nr:5-hydroxytryptamine receptor 3A-like [Melanotaenia boesemani]